MHRQQEAVSEPESPESQSNGLPVRPFFFDFYQGNITEYKCKSDTCPGLGDLYMDSFPLEILQFYLS